MRTKSEIKADQISNYMLSNEAKTTLNTDLILEVLLDIRDLLRKETNE